jgi:hypothetical protein
MTDQISYLDGARQRLAAGPSMAGFTFSLVVAEG